MRALILSGIVLVLGGCSCSRDPGQDEAEAAAAMTTPDTSAKDADELAAQVASANTNHARATAMSEAISTVHAYLAAVANKDWTKADAYWTGGKPPPRADDHAVRGIEDLRSLRINNDAPKPLDSESPPRSLEVPVDLRVRKDTGTQTITGWYRLRRKVGGDGWEITSASLQPAMD